MNASENANWWSDEAVEARLNTMLLGRLGGALEGIYRSTLNAPIPASLQQLTARLCPGATPPDGSADEGAPQGR